MSELPRNYHDIPNPDGVAAGRNNRDGGGDNSPAQVARLYKPQGAPPDEVPVSTLARFAGRLIDRATGKAYTAGELAALAAAGITPESIGAATAASVDLKLDLKPKLYANDSEASADGVPWGGIYRAAEGQTQWNYKGRIGAAFAGETLYQAIKASFSLDDLGFRDAHGFRRLTPTGSIETANGAFAGSLRSVRFPAEDRRAVSSDPVFDGGSFTVSAWVYLESAPGGIATIISQYKTTGNQRGFRFEINTDRTIQLDISSDGTSANLTQINFAAAIPLNTWTHVLIEHETGAEARITLDGGTPESVAYTAGMADVAAGWGLNGYDGGGTVGGKVRLDAVHAFGGLLSAADKATLAAGVTYHDDINPTHTNQYDLSAFKWGWSAETAVQDATIARRGSYVTTLTKSGDSGKTLAVTGASETVTITTNKDQIYNDFTPTLFTDGAVVGGVGTPTAALNGDSVGTQTVIPDRVSGTVQDYGAAHCHPVFWKTETGELRGIHPEICRGERWISENGKPLAKADLSAIGGANRANNDRYHYSSAGLAAGGAYDLLAWADHNRRIYIGFGSASGGTWSPDANGWQMVENIQGTYVWMAKSKVSANTYWLLARSSATQAYGLTLYKIVGEPGGAAATITVDRLINSAQRGYPRAIEVAESADGTSEFVSIAWQERLSASWEGAHLATYDVAANRWKSANGTNLSITTLGTDATPRFPAGELAQDGHAGAGTRITGPNSTNTRYLGSNLEISYDTATGGTFYLGLWIDGNSNNPNSYMAVQHFFQGGWDSGSGYAKHLSTAGDNPFGLDNSTTYRTHAAILRDGVQMLLIAPIRGPQVPKNGPDGEDSTEEYFSFGGIGLMACNIATLWESSALDTAIAGLDAATVLRTPLATEDTIAFIQRVEGFAGVAWNQPLEKIGYSCVQMGTGFGGEYEMMSKILT